MGRVAQLAVRSAERALIDAGMLGDEGIAQWPYRGRFRFFYRRYAGHLRFCQYAVERTVG